MLYNSTLSPPLPHLNRKSLIKNLVTFNFIMGVDRKIWLFSGVEVHKLKVGGLSSFQILVGRGPGKERGGVLSPI